MPSAPCTIGLVFGGVSGEHAVSIRSAVTVAGALRRGANVGRYRLCCFYIDLQGHWWPPAVADAVLAQGVPPAADQLPATPVRAGFQGLPTGAADVEVWFPVLHGPNGEDGTIQGLFSLMQVPFVGSGVLGSAVGMDKLAMKAAFAAAGLPQVAYQGVDAAELEGQGVPLKLLERLEHHLGYPCFIKPANLGSSVGISKAIDRPSLLAGLREAARHDHRLVVERGVKVRELECAVLGKRQLRASVVGEIRFDADWYDYTAKYSEGLSHTLIPAPVAEPVSERARAMAIEACRAVAAEGLARVDFFYDEASGDLWLNEINTLPGFTSQSMYPMLWEATDLPLEGLVHELVQLARESRRDLQAGAQAA
ncbi:MULTISPECIES: D-alanine--D-alanine ligase family protein [unclassified Synechococcus]|uniref:D-alanine--D-alanine ligase family protein n=1 Tax=unclassified Synechococcus TaxID=2626047 RepID=UPI000B991E57|nr:MULTISPECIES: D-alanine--D-alanine ligase family protein [unclassified Synechococcus]MCP9846475.1 D-alanine--D-alanine ligase [Synechococcus sp. Lug-A]